ncbi:hypothetical protein SDC9_109618 [bioreactor metagenome]|uniref:Uncharacterized protein n=1 Tax=bioreactor metagenome TaxID=1076179 RepID=A0A645BDM2_9ZZZZ
MKSRIAFLVVSLILLLLITVFAGVKHEKPNEEYMVRQEMQDGATRYEGTDGTVAIVEEWHPASSG